MKPICTLDRLIITQGIADRLTIMTADKHFASYESSGFLLFDYSQHQLQDPDYFLPEATFATQTAYITLSKHTTTI